MQQDARGKSKSKDNQNSEKRIQNNSNQLFAQMNQDNLKYIQSQIKQKNKKNQVSFRKKSEQQTIQPSIQNAFPQKISQKQSKLEQTQRSKQVFHQRTVQPSSPSIDQRELKIAKTDGQSQIQQYKYPDLNRSKQQQQQIFSGLAGEHKLSEQVSGEAYGNKLSYYDLISQAKSKRMPSLEAEYEQSQNANKNNLNMNIKSLSATSKQTNNFLNFLSTYIEDLNNNKKNKNMTNRNRNKTYTNKNQNINGNMSSLDKKTNKKSTSKKQYENKNSMSNSVQNKYSNHNKNKSMENNANTISLQEGQYDQNLEIYQDQFEEQQNRVPSREGSAFAHVQIEGSQYATLPQEQRNQSVRVLKNVLASQHKRSMCLAKQIQQRRKEQQLNKMRLAKLEQCLSKLTQEFELFKSEVRVEQFKKANMQNRYQHSHLLNASNTVTNVSNMQYNSSAASNPNNFTLNQFKIDANSHHYNPMAVPNVLNVPNPNISELITPNLIINSKYNAHNPSTNSNYNKLSHRKNLTTFSVLSNSLGLHEKDPNLHMGSMHKNEDEVPSISINKYQQQPDEGSSNTRNNSRNHKYLNITTHMSVGNKDPTSNKLNSNNNSMDMRSNNNSINMNTNGNNGNNGSNRVVNMGKYGSIRQTSNSKQNSKYNSRKSYQSHYIEGQAQSAQGQVEEEIKDLERQYQRFIRTGELSLHTFNQLHIKQSG